jgi:archaemetzincin
LYPEIEDRLRPLATPLGPPQPGEWLAQHVEKGQTFRQYLAANPVRRSAELTRIYLFMLGDFTDHQVEILDRCQKYLSIFFDVPVEVHRRIPLTEIPPEARRKHPEWGDKQLLTSYILNNMLEPHRPDDALAYLALTARDLWPGSGWNFVFGQANLRRRVGVWSIYRNGYPGKSAEAYRLCLRRTLSIATHETGHILTIDHCTAYHCLMNGSNHQEERDSRPLHMCPVCLRKLLWNLQADPSPYLQRLRDFAQDNAIDEEAGWYSDAIASLGQ